MKLKLTCTVVVLTIALTAACKKHKKSEETTPTPETPAVTYPDYAKLKVGNYWIYGRFQIYQNSNDVTDLHQSDSCYVEKDTVIGGRTFFKLRKHDFVFGGFAILFLRDSLHYIVDWHGAIQFSSQDFSTVFATSYMTEIQPTYDSIPPRIDTLYKITRRMNDKDLVMSVPAGSFKTSAMESLYLAVDSMLSSNPAVDNPRHLYMRYAENIGLITETELFYSSEYFMTERRLLRYHVN